jgi:hypothetical protein
MSYFAANSSVGSQWCMLRIGAIFTPSITNPYDNSSAKLSGAAARMVRAACVHFLNALLLPF